MERTSKWICKPDLHLDWVCHHDSPFVMQVDAGTAKKSADTLMTEFEQIFRESKETVKNKDKQVWWASRQSLNDQLKVWKLDKSLESRIMSLARPSGRTVGCRGFWNTYFVIICFTMSSSLVTQLMFSWFVQNVVYFRVKATMNSLPGFIFC